MALFNVKTSDYVQITVDGKSKKALKQSKYASFNDSLLGLGDLSQKSKAIDAISVYFDLEGFTNFTKQIDPHLAVPQFQASFLHWLMEELKLQNVVKESGKLVQTESGVVLYKPLPFFIKFMGDGLLILYDASMMRDQEHLNAIVGSFNVCHAYKRDFLKTLTDTMVDPPPALRCGLARGTVYTVGNGNDFIGSCINMSARLQRLPGTTFAFNRRGFDFSSHKASTFFTDQIIICRVSIRGINDNELIGILKVDFDKLQKSDKKIFRPVSMRSKEAPKKPS